MTVKELLDRLGIDFESTDHVRIERNGMEKEPNEIPCQNFKIDRILVTLEQFPDCEIKIYPD